MATTTSEVDLEELTGIVVSNLVGFAESAGGVGQIEFGAFVGALAGGYADLNDKDVTIIARRAKGASA